MNPSQKLIDFVIGIELFRPVAYWDNNGFAIGYGSHYVNNKKVIAGQTITQEDAENELVNDLYTCYNYLGKYLPSVILKQSQADALADFIYNLGIGNFLNSTLYNTLADKGTVTEEMFTSWNKELVNGVLVVNSNLMARRVAEYNKFWIA
jgi:GH24 family phage-related lysozyme (muramidase)